MIRKTVQIKEETISYLVDEKIGNIVVLFLHGFGDEAIRASTLFKNEDRMYSIIAPDMPGCGQSTNNHKNITMEYYCQIVEEFINTSLPEKRLYIVTHSLGTITALYNAVKNPNIIQIFAVAPLMPRDEDEKMKQKRIKWLLPTNGEELYDSQLKLFCEHDNSYIIQENVKNKIINTGVDFYNHRHSTFTELANEIVDGSYVKEIYSQYFKNKHDFMAFVSVNDEYFDYPASKKYLDLYDIKSVEINDSGHAMFYKNTPRIHKYINNFILKKEGFY
ncbi:alpha/beta hydrolase [Mycoplasma sp. HS2188]|uniref:alpha/beta hydrolase n=1 Tax=Mycoplasma sp. HS2188 TaxID=2976765 RepID=UPI0021A993C9|nr:alpha/beta hydrolase [Mycoplasma sp. HS2188]MCT4469562.1 alpha/beta hydrolase [Mycoplasma sp. HS2188]